MLYPLRRWFRRLSPRPVTKDRRPRYRPQLDPLEDRLAPAVYDVIGTADGTGTVTPTATPGTFLATTLRAAITAVNNATDGASNVINLTVAGTYQITLAGTPGETDNAAGEFAIIPTGTNGSSLTIQNTSGGAVTVDANHLNRVFDINPNNTTTSPKFAVTMTGFTVTNGVASPGDAAGGTGGGIRDQNNVSLTLIGMTLSNNSATADGGGVSMENAPASTAWTLTLTDCTVSGNHAGDAGGGVETDGTGHVNITGSVVSGNTCVNQGAGIWLDALGPGSATLDLTGSLVSDNSALNGPTGAVGNAGTGAVMITGSTVENNFSGSTGGGFGDESNLGTLAVTGSLFLDNSAVGDGGGIQEGGPSTSITDSVLEGNSSNAAGGGLFANGATLTILDSSIINNTSAFTSMTPPFVGGGGIELQTTGTGANASTITNTTIAGNSVLNSAGGNNGGGIDASANFTGTLALLNDTINGNYADTGGGVFWAGTGGSTVSVENTIIAGNDANVAGPDADNAAGTFTDNGGNLIGVSGAGSGNSGFTAGTTHTGTVSMPLGPKLGPLQNNGGPTVGAPGNTVSLQTEALLPGSPAIDNGVAAGAPTQDERGFARPDTVGENPDVGAFEFQDVTLAVSLRPASPVVFLGGSDTFAVTVTDTSGNALPADNTTVTVALPAGLGGGTVTFAVGPLAADGSATFFVPVTATALGPQTVTAAVTSPDANPNTVSTSATVASVLPPAPPVPVIPNASVPPNTVLSFPFAPTVGNPVFVIVTRLKGKKFFLTLLVNTSPDAVFGRLLLFGLTPKQFNTGLTAFGVPALDLFLPPDSAVPLQLPLKTFFPVFVAGF
jgi:hypothetical protein